jgi:cell division cycle 14
MRIIRPGCVVGPQQQYMYLKQLEWCKWAAVDDLRKMQAATALATATLVTPATPPAEADEEMDAVQTTPPKAVAVSVPVPPVTPSRHIAAAQAKAKAIAPPEQPRKTPVAKRVAVDSDDEDDESADVLPALGVVPPARTKPKAPVRTAGSRATASEQRPTRVLRSTAGGAARKPTTTGHGPNKIPRLAAGTTARNTAATARAPTPGARRPRAPPSPTPSRLPTLIPAKRTHHATNSLSEVASAATLKMAGAASDAWMTNNASAVVVPGSKSERPGLRSVRRRRSSFSAADVVA